MKVTLSDITVSRSFHIEEVEKGLRKYGPVVLPDWLDVSELNVLRSEFDDAIVDSNETYAYQMTMMDARHSDRFQKIRRDHIEDKLDGSVCGNCIRASKTPPKALNDDLINHVIFWAKPITQTGPSGD